MANGDTAVLAVGAIKCSEGTCSTHTFGDEVADYQSMVAINALFGEVRCTEDDASCVLDGEKKRAGIGVESTGGGVLTFRALTFYDMEQIFSGGLLILGGQLDIELCIFSNCRAMSTTSIIGIDFSSGAILYVGLSGGVAESPINIYGSSFYNNSAGFADDIGVYSFGGVSGTVTVHNVCPPPYSSNIPMQGKEGSWSFS